MDISILELGTRTFRLLRAVKDSDGGAAVSCVSSERVGIEMSVDAIGTISRSDASDALRVMGRLLSRARRLDGGRHVVTYAPNAFGGAGNASEFGHAVKRRFGVSVTLLSPRDSATLPYHATRHELGPSLHEVREREHPLGVVHVGDPALDFAVGASAIPDFTVSLDLGVARLHRAVGATERGLPTTDAAALFSLVRLSGGPACRRVREWGKPEVAFGSENAKAVRDVARAWGYLDANANGLCRLSLHALVPEILAAPPDLLVDIGILPSRASLVGTTAVVIDALSDLLGLRTVRFSAHGLPEGVARSIFLRGNVLEAGRSGEHRVGEPEAELPSRSGHMRSAAP